VVTLKFFYKMWSDYKAWDVSDLLMWWVYTDSVICAMETCPKMNHTTLGAKYFKDQLQLI
jgi:hypothetical protein